MSPQVPRVAAVVFILFVSLFAIDAFDDDAPFLDKILGFLFHLIPSSVLVACTVWAWRQPVYGGYAFIAASMAFTLFFNTYRRLPSFLALSVPLFLIGAMFIASGGRGTRKSA